MTLQGRTVFLLLSRVKSCGKNECGSRSPSHRLLFFSEWGLGTGCSHCPGPGKRVGVGAMARSGHPVGILWGLPLGPFCFCLGEAGAQVRRRWPRQSGHPEAPLRADPSRSTRSLNASGAESSPSLPSWLWERRWEGPKLVLTFPCLHLGSTWLGQASSHLSIS